MSSSATRLRQAADLYPDFSEEIEAVKGGRVDAGLVQRVIARHKANAAFNRALYSRYAGVEVPIFRRRPRFEEQEAVNSRVNNDFFGEIVDFKTGYFAGKPIGYSYSVTAESAAATGGTEAAPGGGLAEATKAVTDFAARNNLYDVDMETTKLAACCGYAARLFYLDEAGCERVMVVPPFQAAILSETTICEPLAGVWYTLREGEGDDVASAVYYDAAGERHFAGPDFEHLREMPEKAKPNLFGLCPLQGIPNNAEMQGDAEKVLATIDAYDRAVSDNCNEQESFASAYMIFEAKIDDEEVRRGQRSGAFVFPPPVGGRSGGQPVYFLTKEINDSFNQNHLERLEQNIYRFSKTPNLNDVNFAGQSTGQAMKFKLTGLESKCGMFQAKMQCAGAYMFRLLAGAWAKKGLMIDPLQCVMDFHRNFPLDVLGEAQAVQAMVNAGVPRRVAFAQLSFVDDVEYLMGMAEEERGVTDGETGKRI